MLSFFFSSRGRHTRLTCDWSSDVCSSDLTVPSADDPRLGAWRAFLHAHARLLRRLDEELQAEQIGRASCRERVLVFVVDVCRQETLSPAAVRDLPRLLAAT